MVILFTLPTRTGSQVAFPRFILGAVLVQMWCTSMENMDTEDKNTPTGGTTWTPYPHLYGVDKKPWDFGSRGCGFESCLGRHHIWEILLRISLFGYIWGVFIEPFPTTSSVWCSFGADRSQWVWPVHPSDQPVFATCLIPERFASEPNGPRTPLELLRLLLIRLSDHWVSYRVFDWQPDVPWTNNGTERVIGRMKMRSRTVRGYKSAPTMLAGLMAAGAWVY